jgi:hypothetical protein
MNVIPKPEHGSPEWLMLRHRDPDGRPLVSASEAAAVHGEHRFISKYGLAVAKMAELPVSAESTRAMERGNRLESTLLEWLGDEIGVNLSEPKVMYSAYEYGMIATLDGIDQASCMLDASEPIVVAEIKTFNREWDGVLPRYWYWQGVQQAICAGVDEITWGVFDARLDLHVHVQQVSGQEKIEHVEAVNDFLKFVSEGEIPAEWPATYDEISSTYPQSNGLSVDLSEQQQLFARLREVQADKKLLADEEEQLKASIGQLLGENEVGLVNGQQVVSWKPQSRKSFDSKRFASEHKDLYDQYQTSSSFRVMRFKGEK